MSRAPIFQVGDRVRPRESTRYGRSYFSMAGDNGEATVTRTDCATGSIMFVSFDSGYNLRAGYGKDMGVWKDGFELAAPAGPDAIEMMFA